MAYLLAATRAEVFFAEHTYRRGDLIAVYSLRCAVDLVRRGLAEPANRYTALDVELGLLLQRVIPRLTT